MPGDVGGGPPSGHVAVTYGGNVGVIRDELTALLGQHRIQQRIGGNGSYVLPESTTRAEREALGRVVRRYRYAVLVWCFQALHAIGDKREVPREGSDCTSVQRLQRLLVQNLQDGPGTLRLTELLSRTHEFELVTRWQRAARAAALGEHDFAAGVDRGRLAPAQCTAVALDAVQIVRALTVLDPRYALVPGWGRLARRDRLARVAAELHDTLQGLETDTTVDMRGRRSQPAWSGRVDGRPQRGVASAVASQHDLVVALERLPTALNLRRVMSLQALASRAAAQCAHRGHPELITAFEERADVYRQLVADCRNLAGLVGSGGDAVVEGHRVLNALKSAGADWHPPETTDLWDLRRLFAATDARTTVLLERGLAERCYFVGVTVPRLGTDRRGGVVHARLRYMPVDTQPKDPILPLVRNRLRPTVPPLADASASRDRRPLGCALGDEISTAPKPPTPG